MNRHASNSFPGDMPVGRSRQSALVRFTRGALCLFAVLILSANLTAVAAPGPTEYQLKATFIFNFVKFTDWPAAAFTNGTAPIVIGMVGESPFDHTLDELVSGEAIDGHRLVVRRLKPDEDFSPYHVLFICRSEKDRLPTLLATLKKKPILTISDLDRFCEQGGMINLALAAGGTVQPEINPAAAKLAGLQISSHLLSLPKVRLVEAAH